MTQDNPKPLTTELGWSTADKVVVRGKDLANEILGHMNLGDMAFLELTGRVPDAKESAVFNAIVITLVEHGITPSALAARLTYTGAPEALQAAVAAGLSGLGSVFVGSMEGAARMLYDAFADAGPEADIEALAATVVGRYRQERKIIPGVGHPVHKPVDPRAVRLFEIAEANGFAGRHVQLMQSIQRQAERQAGRVLPLNATGAIGAICCEFGFPWNMVRGIGVMARAIGLVGHLMEEARNPIGMELWARTEAEAVAARR